MSTLLKYAVGLGLATLALASQAETKSFKGTIAFHHSVALVPFTLAADAARVRNWTDQIGAHDNFANSLLFGDGVPHGTQTPIPLADWCQPYNNCTMGANWAVPVKTDSMGMPVPEPLSYALILMGLGLIGFRIRYGNSL